MPDMTLKELISKSHRIALKHGWWQNNREVNVAILMVMTELAEAVQEDRRWNDEGLYMELADTLIRLADLIGHLGIDIEPIIRKKMAINEKREKMHGRKY